MTIFFSNLKICLRSGSFKLLVYIGFVAVALAIMMSAFAGRQPQTLLVDFAFSTLRITLCLSTLLWVQELLVKPIETKNVVQYLAYPSARFQYLLSIFCSIIFVLILAVMFFALMVQLVSYTVTEHQQSTPIDFGLAYWLTWWFMVMDIAVVLGFCFAVAVVSTTPYLAVVVALGFYIAGHAVQQMMDLLSIAVYIDGRDFFSDVLDFIRYIIPDLSIFDVRHWSLYGEAIEWPLVLSKILTALAFMVVCLCLAGYSFNRREIV